MKRILITTIEYTVLNEWGMPGNQGFQLFNRVAQKAKEITVFL